MYPALAVLQKLLSSVERLSQDKLALSSKIEVLWVGGQAGMEVDLVKRAEVPIVTIPAAGIHGVGMFALPKNLWRIGRGVLAARRVLNKYNPDVIFFTGGYVGVPVTLATRFMVMRTRRPSILAYVPDIEPGLALRLVARFADHIAVTVDDSSQYFLTGKKITVTGYPTRDNLLGWDRNTALKELDLSPDLPTLLVLGGSRGARSINRAVLSVLPELLTEMQVLHISGALDWPEVEKTMAEKVTRTQTERYRAYPYLHAEMGAALSVADLVVSRAGASTLGEFPLFGLPAVLVPYPYAWRYQIVNAHYLSDHGAAVVLKDEHLKSGLLPIVQRLIRDKDRREAMSRAMRSLACPSAAESIGNLVCNLATRKSQNKD